jgi:hypothetical protein
MNQKLFTLSNFYVYLLVCLSTIGLASLWTSPAEAHVRSGLSNKARAAFQTYHTRIMPLGNSITQARVGHNSYRRPLWHRLAGAGYQVNFVGSQNSNHEGPPANPDFDQDHEGHWGWRADQLLGGISGWAQDHQPDIVLMHVGSNDMFQGQDLNSTVSELEQIIDRLRSVNPQVKILLARLIEPTEWNGRWQRIRQLNDAIPGIASHKSTSQSPVILVDQTQGFNADYDTYDGVHPNPDGESKMADRWFEALARILSPNTPAPAPAPPTAIIPPPASGSFPGYYQLIARHSGKAMDVMAASLDNGASIIQYTPHSDGNQQWSFESTGDGHYWIKARHSGKALSINQSDNLFAEQADYRGSDSQKWQIEATDGGYYRISNKANGHVLDVNGASTHDFAAILIWSFHGEHNQHWRLQPVQSSGRVASAQEDRKEIAQALSLYPNPAAGKTHLRYRANYEQVVRIVVITTQGQEVSTTSQQAVEGENEAEINLSGLSKGMYSLKVMKDNKVFTRKLAIAR